MLFTFTFIGVEVLDKKVFPALPREAKKILLAFFGSIEVFFKMFGPLEVRVGEL